MREFRKVRPDVRVQLLDADSSINMVDADKLDLSLGIFKAMRGVHGEPSFAFL